MNEGVLHKVTNSDNEFPGFEKIRQDFPILERTVNGYPLVYLDNAASSQKPGIVIDTLSDYYTRYNANVHRGVHTLSQEGTEAYEQARHKVQQFIGARSSSEIIFTSGTTESINLVADTFARQFLHAGDEVLISWMEHHSNIVPWQLACERSGAVLKVLPVTDSGEWDLSELDHYISVKTRLVAVSHVSNTLGTINPVKILIEKAMTLGIPVLLDGAQAVPHMRVDVQDLDCDFYCFSGHKMCAPTGTGVLYGKAEWLEQLSPYKGGGDMIRTVTFEKTTYNELPFKFEAGTPHISGVIGLGAAIDYLTGIGMDRIAARERELLDLAVEQLSAIEGIRFIGTAADKAAVCSFLLGDVHPYDVGVILDKLGVAVRTGHHCTQPLMDRYGIPGTIRASFAFYNNESDVERLTEAVKRAARMLI